MKRVSSSSKSSSNSSSNSRFPSHTIMPLTEKPMAGMPAMRRKRESVAAGNTSGLMATLAAAQPAVKACHHSLSSVGGF